MKSPLFRLLALCAASFFAGVASPANRDWGKDPAVVQLDTDASIFAIGDAHGDYTRLVLAMKTAGLIAEVEQKPEDVRWAGGNAVLVTTGDMIDKGPRAIDVLMLLRGLRSSAVRTGGRVIVLAGNHEVEFLANPAAPKGKEFYAQLVAGGIRPADAASCTSDVGEFLCSLPFAARVNHWFFSHAGNTGGRSISQLIADLQQGITTDGYASRQLIGDDSVLEARLNRKSGGRPWIDMGLPVQSEKQLLTAYTAALGVEHMVEGHVPSEVKFADGTVRKPGEMFQRFGMLFLIDTGMSQDVDDSRGAVLRITSKDATAICPDGMQTVLWSAKNDQSIGRAAPCQ